MIELLRRHAHWLVWVLILAIGYTITNKPSTWREDAICAANRAYFKDEKGFLRYGGRAVEKAAQELGEAAAFAAVDHVASRTLQRILDASESGDSKALDRALSDSARRCR